MFGNKPAFGAAAPSTSFGSSGLFGQAPTTGGGLFSNTSTFSFSRFGATPQNNSFLGVQQPQASSIFNPTPNPGLFGGTSFGSNQQTGTQIKFVAATGSDTMMKNGTAQGISTKHQSITCMKEYENKSFEELRFEDYQANRKGPQQGAGSFGVNTFGTATSATPSLFGQPDANKQSAFGQATSFGQPSAFGQTTNQPTAFGAPPFGATTSTTPSLFGQTDPNKSAFGQPAFGQTSAFGQNTSGGFGLNANQNNTSFGKPTTFGTGTGTTGFGFGNTAPQNANPFGTSTANNPTFGAGQTKSLPLLFGNNTSQPNTGFGTGLFSNNQNTGTGLFSKPAQPTTGFGATGQNTGFSFNTPASTQASLFPTTSKPLFGTGTSTTPAFGTTNTFGTNNTGFGNAFGKPATPAFGQTQPATNTFGTGFGTTNTFGTNNAAFGTNFSKPAATGFGQTSLTGLNTFNSGGLGNNQTAVLFGNQNQNKPGGLFSTSNSLFNNPSTTFQYNAFGQVKDPPLFAPPDQSRTNLALLTSDPFGDAPHLSGLEPKFRTNDAAISATDPKQLKALLDTSKMVHFTQPPKLKMIPLKSKRNSLFDTPPKANDQVKSPLADYQKTNVRKLVLKPKPASEKSPLLNSSNILDILLSEDNENHYSDSKSTPVKSNPVRLTFDTTINNDSLLNNSVETQNVKLVDSTSKEELLDQSGRESPPPPSDDDEEDLGNKPGAGDASQKHPANIICTRPEYYTLPSLDELTPDEDGKCFVKGFTVGRKGYGNVYFPDEIDVAGLNLDELVHFRYREINVYPDDSKKPPVGEGLNRKAQVTLDNVYPRKMGTNILIKDVGELIRMNFSEKLRKVTEKKAARFMDYRPETGSWVFKVDHFSKYGFNDSDEESDQNGKETGTKQTTKSDIKGKQALKKPEARGKDVLQEKERVPEEDSGTGDVPTKGGFRLEQEIFLDEDEPQENDLLHHSMLMDDTSEEDFQATPHPSSMDRLFEPYHKSRNAKNIQLMKSSLFADDATSSDDARSHVSILKQYLDLQDIPEDDEEDLRRLTTVMEEQQPDPGRTRAMLRPKIWNVLNNYQSSKSVSSLLPSRCCVDIGIFKGKSFRVGWGKGFNFYALDNKESYSNSEVFMKAFEVSQEFDPLKDVLIESLQAVLEDSTFQTSTLKVPTFKILKSDSYLKKQSQLFSNLATQYSSAQANYLNSIWTLCTALWGPNENTISNRRYLLSEWLKSTCISDDLTLKTSPFKSVTEVTESVFAHLSVFQVLDAACVAMDNRMPNLALLVSQSSLSNMPKSYLQEQIDVWYKSMISNHISTEIRRLYLLLSGIPIKEDLNVFEEVDWKRAFGMHLWFISPNDAPIETAIDLYCKAFKEFSYAEKPHPPYLKNVGDEGPFDILFHILMLYKSRIHRLSSTLNPATHTNDPLDYRLSWLLLQLFLSLDVGLIENYEITKFCTSFSTQLEHLGHWEWAIFVLLYLEDNFTKTNLIMGILDRNLSIDELEVSEENSQEIVNILVNKMQIPGEWIHLVKGHKSVASERYFEAYNHFALAEEFARANEIYVDKLLPSLFINEQYDNIRNLSEKLKIGSKDIQHWNNQTGLILDYLDLLEDSITEDNLIKLQMKLYSLSERIVSFPTSNDQQKVCVAELAKRCASLYKELCDKLQGNRINATAYDQFIETLVMPPDFKQHEGLYAFARGFGSFSITGRV
ncbi:hypothetical protein ABEB36_007706 [Hypothenemus hampei]|uniref:Nuclear pore complex protein Nup98-Nup96 n=1 Tax=Hypothenemus hampei TaxID=57062 RepID=A0ABD1EVH4_HYPHA